MKILDLKTKTKRRIIKQEKTIVNKTETKIPSQNSFDSKPSENNFVRLDFKLRLKHTPEKIILFANIIRLTGSCKNKTIITPLNPNSVKIAVIDKNIIVLWYDTSKYETKPE